MLLGIFAIVAIMVAGSVLLTKAIVRLMGKLGGETVDKLHRSAEYIIDTGKVPPLWQEGLEKRLSSLRNTGNAARTRAGSRSARAKCLKQMRKLIAYFSSSPAVADEETRQIILTELESVHKQWLREDWDEMISCAHTDRDGR